MTLRRPAVALGIGASLWLLLAVSARPPEAGASWRIVFVVAALLGSGYVVWLARWWSPAPRRLLLWAVLARVAFIPLLPSVSDDGYRYLWDGMVQTQGSSPYAAPPSDPRFEALHGTVPYARMNSRDYPSVYPPLSQVGFRLAAGLLPLGWIWAWYGWKLLAVGAELAGVWALSQLVGPKRAALYALHPVALVEVAGQAHTEGLLIGVLALLAVGGTRFAGISAAASVAVKLWPVAWVPVLLRTGGTRSVVAFAIVSVSLAVISGGGFSWEQPASSLALYAGTFDFYSAPYRLLKSGLHPFWAEEAGRAAAVTLATAWGGLVIGVSAVSVARVRGVLRVIAITTVGYTLASSTLHPWHLLPALWVIPLLHYTNALYWLISVAPLSYLTYVWGPGAEVAMGVGWGGAAVLAFLHYRGGVLRAIMRHRARAKADRLVPFLSAVRGGETVLDLGAGEGYVGQVVARRLGARLESVDVVRYGDPEVRVDLYDGMRLPAPDGRYAASILSFVLHHAECPEEVVREAVRVTDGPVVIVETVHRGGASKRWIEWLDRRVNRLRSGRNIDEAVLDIRTAEEWQESFRAEGFRIAECRRWGWAHPRALYVLDGHASRSRTTRADAASASNRAASS